MAQVLPAQVPHQGEHLNATGFSYTLSLINEKYKMTVLYTLARFGVVRFNKIKRYIRKISYKTLSATLKELGGRPAGPPGGVPPDSPQGGVQPDGAGAVPDPHSGRDLRLGGAKPAVGQRNGPDPRNARSGPSFCHDGFRRQEYWRTTATTFPSSRAQSPLMGWNSGFSGRSQMWPSFLRRVFTVASSSKRATTMSPLIKLSC